MNSEQASGALHPATLPQPAAEGRTVRRGFAAGAALIFLLVLAVYSPASAATTGDNAVDNVEQVSLPSPSSGTYLVRVTHKGALLNDLGQTNYQNVSIMLSGNIAQLPILPQITSLAALTVSNTLALKWASEVGRVYRLQYVNTLSSSNNWQYASGEFECHENEYGLYGLSGRGAQPVLPNRSGAMNIPKRRTLCQCWLLPALVAWMAMPLIGDARIVFVQLPPSPSLGLVQDINTGQWIDPFAPYDVQGLRLWGSQENPTNYNLVINGQTAFIFSSGAEFGITPTGSNANN